MPRRAKVVDVLAVRLVKQGTETTRFRTGSPLHLCQYVYMQASMIILSFNWLLRRCTFKSIERKI